MCYVNVSAGLLCDILLNLGKVSEKKTVWVSNGSGKRLATHQWNFVLKKGKAKGSKYFDDKSFFGFCEIFILWRWNRKLTKAFDIYETFILWRWNRKLTKAFDIYSMEVEPEMENCVTPWCATIVFAVLYVWGGGGRWVREGEQLLFKGKIRNNVIPLAYTAANRAESNNNNCI
jgi:hypothetical protein